MNHIDFAGWSEHDIDYRYFRERLRSYNKTLITKQGPVTITVYEDIRTYDTEQMSKFIEEVMCLMITEHDGMVIKDPHDFKLNKYLKQ